MKQSMGLLTEALFLKSRWKAVVSTENSDKTFAIPLADALNNFFYDLEKEIPTEDVLLDEHDIIKRK